MPYTLLVPPSLGAARASARAELLESSLASELGIDVRVHVAADYGELQRDALANTAELVWAPAAVIAQLDEVRALLRAVRGGFGRYHSAIVARADKRVTVDTLRGLKAAWVDPLSAGGYLLPLAWLRGQGIEPNLVFDQQDFLGSHRAVVDAVLDGKYDIAAVSTPSREEAALQKCLAFYAGGAAERLRVIGVSDSAPCDALIITTKLDAAAADRIVQKLAPIRGRTPSFLLTAMEAERLERAPLDEYREMRSLLWAKRSDRPPSRRP
jgi:ABC-type phosphate/phosphonate transport system substrate-binding protein